MTDRERYIIARWAYAIGEDIGVGDIEYRQLEEKVRQENPNDEYVNRSWSDDPCPMELLEKHNMTELYRDIKFAFKSESIESLNTWEEVRTRLGGLNVHSRLSYKNDGFNIHVNYYNGRPISAETRGRKGNSLNANVVLRIVPPKIPLGGKVKVIGELVIPNKIWDSFKRETGTTSQRSAVSTALARGMTDCLAFVAFSIRSDNEQITRDQYDLLRDFGFTTSYIMKVDNYMQLEKAIELMGHRLKAYPYPTDGLVIENQNCQLALRVGKWQEKSLQSYVTSIEENIGIYNNPIVVKIKPIEHNGATRREVSVTNIQYLLDCNLQVGAPIAFDIRSMAAPVLNTMRTNALHQEWLGRWEDYCKTIDEIAIE